ncbi:MAG TPA: N-acetyltransferase [Cytophagales bacterium]|nr:N-acetyltransferase [Cytophagales bacterium]
MNNPDFYSHPTTIIDANCEIGKGTKIWHFCHIMPNCKIGENCNIGQNCVISPNVLLGKNVKIQNNVSLYTGLECEDDVFLGPSVVFTNILNPRSAIVRRDNYLKTQIRKGASLGANSTILCGIEIGEYALIGAGAVVTKDVKPYALVIGNPARQTGWVSEYGHKLHFDSEGKAICPEEKSHYLLNSGFCKKIQS